MVISEVKLFLPKDTSSKLKASGTFVLDKAVEVNYTLLEGPKGLFVGMPGNYGKKQDPATGKLPFYQSIKILDKKIQADLTKAVLEAYNKKTSGSVTSQGHAAGPDSQVDDIPF